MPAPSSPYRIALAAAVLGGVVCHGQGAWDSEQAGSVVVVATCGRMGGGDEGGWRRVAKHRPSYFFWLGNPVQGSPSSVPNLRDTLSKLKAAPGYQQVANTTIIDGAWSGFPDLLQPSVVPQKARVHNSGAPSVGRKRETRQTNTESESENVASAAASDFGVNGGQREGTCTNASPASHQAFEVRHEQGTSSPRDGRKTHDSFVGVAKGEDLRDTEGGTNSPRDSRDPDERPCVGVGKGGDLTNEGPSASHPASGVEGNSCGQGTSSPRGCGDPEESPFVGADEGEDLTNGSPSTPHPASGFEETRCGQGTSPPRDGGDPHERPFVGAGKGGDLPNESPSTSHPTSGVEETRCGQGTSPPRDGPHERPFVGVGKGGDLPKESLSTSHPTSGVEETRCGQGAGPPLGAREKSPGPREEGEPSTVQRALLDFASVPPDSPRGRRSGTFSAHKLTSPDGLSSIGLVLLDTTRTPPTASPLWISTRLSAVLSALTQYVSPPDPLINDEQWAWLVQLLEEDLDAYIIVSVLPVTPLGLSSWATHPKCRQRLFHLLNGLNKVFFVSGAVLSSHVWEWEVTVNGIAVPGRDLQFVDDLLKRKLTAGDVFPGPSFVLVEADWADRHVRFSVQSSERNPLLCASLNFSRYDGGMQFPSDSAAERQHFVYWLVFSAVLSLLFTSVLNYFDLLDGWRR
ncbi:hypothetical protein DIPPA_20243 [Diplonema papillatum]|nr:hypothetical protein DIPPA_20243 [Diplonema papillatum]